jgi:hypothetical protein
MSGMFTMDSNVPIILLDPKLTYIPLVRVKIGGNAFMLKQRTCLLIFKNILEPKAIFTFLTTRWPRT